MTKKEFRNAISDKIEGMGRSDAALVIDTVAEVITEALQAGDTITIPGVCTFSTVEKPETTGIIQMGDKKGETWVSPAHNAPKCKISATLKNAVKQ